MGLLQDLGIAALSQRCTNNSISACTLRLIGAGVCSLEERSHKAGVVGGGNTNAARKLKRAAVDHDRVTKLTSNAGSYAGGRNDVLASKENNKLIAAITNGETSVSCRVVDPIGQYAQHSVADVVPMVVVDWLELVEVDEDHRGLVLMQVQQLIETPSICQPGQRIVCRVKLGGCQVGCGLKREGRLCDQVPQGGREFVAWILRAPCDKHRL